MHKTAKKIMFIGNVGSGKTTLCQRLIGQEKKYKKTQAVEIVGTAIDTPGEYLENKRFQQALVVTATGADIIGFVADPTNRNSYYMPGQADMFPQEVVGIISKTDIASAEEIESARMQLQHAGVKKVFFSPDEERQLEKYLLISDIEAEDYAV